MTCDARALDNRLPSVPAVRVARVPAFADRYVLLLHVYFLPLVKVVSAYERGRRLLRASRFTRGYRVSVKTATVKV